MYLYSLGGGVAGARVRSLRAIVCLRACVTTGRSRKGIPMQGASFLASYFYLFQFSSFFLHFVSLLSFVSYHACGYYYISFYKFPSPPFSFVPHWRVGSAKSWRYCAPYLSIIAFALSSTERNKFQTGEY